MPLAISPKSKARAQHLLSYMLVSLVPIMICGILLIGNTYSQHADQEDQAALNGLHMFSSAYSRLMSSMDSCAGHFEDSYADYLRQGASTVCAQIASYKKNYDSFTDVFFYLRGSDNVYTGDGLENYHLFELDFMLDFNVDLNMSQLFSNMNHALTVTALRSRSTLDDSLDGEYTFYLHPVPELDANPIGVIVFVVSNDTLQALLDECVPAEYELYVCSNQYLNWLFRSDRNVNTASLVEYMNRLNSMGIFHVDIAGNSYLLLRDGSEHDSVYHMLAYDSDKLYAGLISERDRSLWVLSAAIVLAALAAYLLHKFMYSPIEALLSLPLPPAEAGERHGVDGLLGSVVSSTQNVLDQNTMLREQARDQSALLTTQAIIAMMHGSSVRDAGLSGVWDADAQLKEYSNYVAMYAECDRIPDDAFYRGEFRKYTGEGYNMFVLPLDAVGQIAVLVNHADAERPALAQAALHALAALDISASCLGVGMSYTWRERIPISLLQAQVAARTAHGDIPYCCFAEDELDTSFTGFLPFYGKMLLCQCILNGEKDLALSTFLKMRTDIMPLSGNDTIMRSWAFFVFDAISSVLHETGNLDLLSSIKLDDILCMPQPRHFALMEDLIADACEYVARQRRQALLAREDSLIRYVDEHFCDQDISLGKLSAEFRFSESCITRMMREKTGMSFLQYVSSKRMEIIKLRLRTTDVPIKDIVSEAGYVDIANFTRKFRTSEGMTPGTYRELHQTKS